MDYWLIAKLVCIFGSGIGYIMYGKFILCSNVFFLEYFIGKGESFFFKEKVYKQLSMVANKSKKKRYRIEYKLFQNLCSFIDINICNAIIMMQ